MFYPIKLDKMRNFRYDMRAIDRIEKAFGKPLMKIDELQDPSFLTVEQAATLIWAGLAHEDKDLTPDKVIDLVSEHSTQYEALKEMWKAFYESQGIEVKEETEETEVETDEKNE